jgi:hypothetical protein
VESGGIFFIKNSISKTYFFPIFYFLDFQIKIPRYVFIYFAATHWRNRENRRKWFSEFAEESGFDPLVASNWYKISLQQIQSKKVLPEKIRKFTLPICKIRSVKILMYNWTFRIFLVKYYP